jgi:very-short-patch-repair endonuclease
MGGEGVLMHKRKTPKIFARAKELQRNMSPDEAKLWKHLRAHQMGDVHFRDHTAPVVRCRGHAIGNYILDFSPEGDDVLAAQECDH